MKKRETTSSERRFLLLWALGALLDAPLAAVLLGLAAEGLPPWFLVVLHAAAATAVYFAPPKQAGWAHAQRHWGQACGLLTLLLPGFGWLAAGWLYLRNRQAQIGKEAYRFEAEQPDFNPVAGLGTQEAIRRQFADATNLVPAADALLRGDRDFKRGAIDLLTRLRTPEAVGWLLKARTDPDPEVRFFATSALTRIRADFETAVRAAERDAANRPGDPAARLAVQRIRYEYAVSGILDDQIRPSVLQSCRDHLVGERDLHSARLLFLVEKHLDAGRALSQLETLARIDPAMRQRWIREKADILFSQGRYAEVRQLAVEHRGDLIGSGQGPDRDWMSAILWWESI